MKKGNAFWTVVVKLLFGFGPYFTAIILGILIAELLVEDVRISAPERILVSLFGGFLVFLVIEWIVFKFCDKDELLKKVDFENERDENKTLLLEMAKDIQLIKISKSRTGAILDKFAKSNLIVESLSSKLSNDLELDEMITNDNDNKSFHDIISALKYDKFIASHFIYNSKEKVIAQIPSFYFVNNIWKEFVDKASCYYSVQLLDNEQAKEYFKNPDRTIEEINHLDMKSKDTKNNTEIKKIFVIEDSFFDTDGKLKVGRIKNYLMKWNESLKDTYATMPIMVIMRSKALGLVTKTNNSLNDIGIFGNVLGIQSINNIKDGQFYSDKLKIDFYFDIEKTRKEKEVFLKLLDKSQMLDKVL